MKEMEKERKAWQEEITSIETWHPGFRGQEQFSWAALNEIKKNRNQFMNFSPNLFTNLS